MVTCGIFLKHLGLPLVAYGCIVWNGDRILRQGWNIESKQSNLFSSRALSRTADKNLLSSRRGNATSYDSFENCPPTCNGTAKARQLAARFKVSALAIAHEDWEDTKAQLREACGLRNVRQTSHCFTDFNHVDCCTMQASFQRNTNEKTLVPGMDRINFLGDHIIDCSIPDSEFVPPVASAIEALTSQNNASSDPKMEFNIDAGSWCTCQLNTPFDVCHKQFESDTAFKLVWCPYDMNRYEARKGSNAYKENEIGGNANGYFFIIVDSDGKVLNYGEPNNVPDWMQGQQESNFRVVRASPMPFYTQSVFESCKSIANKLKS